MIAAYRHLGVCQNPGALSFLMVRKSDEHPTLCVWQRRTPTVSQRCLYFSLFLCSCISNLIPKVHQSPNPKHLSRPFIFRLRLVLARGISLCLCLLSAPATAHANSVLKTPKKRLPHLEKSTMFLCSATGPPFACQPQLPTFGCEPTKCGDAGSKLLKGGYTKDYIGGLLQGLSGGILGVLGSWGLEISCRRPSESDLLKYKPEVLPSLVALTEVYIRITLLSPNCFRMISPCAAGPQVLNPKP